MSNIGNISSTSNVNGMSNLKAVISGYGSAGKRHKRSLESMGIQCTTVDPFVLDVDYKTLNSALQNGHYDIAIIASPPTVHIEQTLLALDYGLSVMCEKPLCSLGQLDSCDALLKHPNVNRVAVAYNYRYHQALLAREWRPEGRLDGDGTWLMYCSQYRQTLPLWGLLLDHVSHDMDILRMCVKKAAGTTREDDIDIWVSDTIFQSVSGEQTWFIYGTISYGDYKDDFEIVESVSTRDQRVRAANLHTPYGTIAINAELEMYERMWQDFLVSLMIKRPQSLSVASAYNTQEKLQVIQDIYDEQRRIKNIYGK